MFFSLLFTLLLVLALALVVAAARPFWQPPRLSPAGDPDPRQYAWPLW